MLSVGDKKVFCLHSVHTSLLMHLPEPPLETHGCAQGATGFTAWRAAAATFLRSSG